VLLGEASYAVYLLQFPLFDYSKQLWTAGGVGQNRSVGAIESSLLSGLHDGLDRSVGLVFKALEQPARSFLQKHKPWSGGL